MINYHYISRKEKNPMVAALSYFLFYNERSQSAAAATVDRARSHELALACKFPTLVLEASFLYNQLSYGVGTGFLSGIIRVWISLSRLFLAG